MGRSFTAAGSVTLLVLAASKATSWAAASCSHETTSWTEKVRGVAGWIPPSLIKAVQRGGGRVHPLTLIIVVQHKTVAATSGGNRGALCGNETGYQPKVPSPPHGTLSSHLKVKFSPSLPLFPRKTNNKCSCPCVVSLHQFLITKHTSWVLVCLNLLTLQKVDVR